MTTTDNSPAPRSLTSGPDRAGRFGEFGGRFVPETLIPACQELEAAFDEAWADPSFRTELADVHRLYSGRPSILTECHNLGAQLGIRLILKREDLNHTGSHKINNVIGQTLLAKRMGKKRIVADTGAGQHGVASATAAALMGLECKVYMGAVDVERQALNVFRMKLLGAEVESGAERQPHAQGRSQRGDAPLGRQRSPTPISASARSSARTRIRTWCASSSRSSATRPTPSRRRLLGGDARCRRRLRRWRLERDGDLHRLRRRTRRRASSASNRPAARRSAAGRPASCTGCGAI